MAHAFMILGLLTFDDKAADEALEKFKEAYKAKEASARAHATAQLAKTQHEKVISKLGQLLAVDEKEVRIAAAKGLGAQTEDRRRAAAILVAGIPPNEKEHAVVAAILEALGSLKETLAAPEVEKHLDHETLDIVKAAVDAAGQIRSVTSIEPLIKLLRELEEAAKKHDGGGIPGKGGGKLGKIGRFERGSKEERDRAKALIPEVKKALHAITKATCHDAKDWEEWWREHKATFRVEK